MNGRPTTFSENEIGETLLLGSEKWEKLYQGMQSKWLQPESKTTHKNVMLKELCYGFVGKENYSYIFMGTPV